MATNKFLTLEGLQHFWEKIKALFATKQEVQETFNKTKATFATNNKALPEAGGNVVKADIVNGDDVKAGDLIIDNTGKVFPVTAVGEQITVGAPLFNLKGVTGDKGEAGKGIYASSVNIDADTDVKKTDIANSTDIKIGDIIVDVNGEVYQVKTVADNTVHVSGVILNLKGATGAKGKGMYATNNINIENNTINKTDVVDAGSVAVHDYLLDNQGDVFEVTAITNTAFTTGNALFNLKGVRGLQGAQGEKGDPFTVKKTYASIEEMNNDFANADSVVKEGDFVIISTTDVNNEDNAKLYVKSASAFTFLSDLSGAQGIKGDKGNDGYSYLSANKKFADDATTALKADIINSANIKVGDSIVNTNGIVFIVTAVADDSVTIEKTTIDLGITADIITNEDIDKIIAG